MNKRPKILIAGIGALVLIIVTALWIMSAVRQPAASDFKQLDAQRQAVDASMNTYSPLFSGFTAEYANAFNEDRPADEQSELKRQYLDSLSEDRQFDLDLLKSMRTSLASKESQLQSPLQEFDESYTAVVEYYAQYATNITNVTESVAGKCDLNSELNVSSSTLGEDYAKAADSCLSALGSAKKTSDDTTKKLLGEIESLVKERRDAFKETIGKEGILANATKLSALASLLTLNGEVAKIQKAYETEVQTEYTKLVNRADQSNQALESKLKPFVSSEGSEK